MSLYDAGARELQDRFDTRRIADRLEEVNVTATFSDFQRRAHRHRADVPCTTRTH